ncbi:hypothetical protein ScPMuIL_000143 [Solemya velum]
MWSRQPVVKEAVCQSSSLSDFQEYSQSPENFSQSQNAQMDSSQYAQVLDLNTQQQYSAGSHPEVFSKSLYEKYMTASSSSSSLQPGDLLSRPSSQASNRTSYTQCLKPQPMKPHITTMKLGFQQQMQKMKAKARERDERDLLSGVVTSVQTCCEELKQSFRLLRENLSQQEGSSADKLFSAITEIIDKINQNHSSLLRTLESKEDRLTSISELQSTVSKKQTRIEELQQHIAELQEKQNLQMVTKVNNSLLSLQSVTERKLQHVLDLSLEQLEQSRGQATTARRQVEESSKQHQQLKWNNQTQLQEIEKRILDELVRLRADFDGQKKDLEYFYRHNSQLYSQKQTRDIESKIKKSMETTSKLTLAHLQNESEKQDSQFKDLWEKQQQDLQCLIKSEIKDNLQERSGAESNRKLELPWQFSEDYPRKVRDQLENLHRTHVETVTNIQREMECYQNKSSNKKKEFDGGNIESFIKPLSNMFNLSPKKKTAEAIQFSEMSRQMFSPGARTSNWNNRIFFSRPQPSPIATVLPQRQGQQEITMNEKSQKNNKKQKTNVLPQRRSQRIKNSSNNTSQETSSEESQTQDSKSSLFDSTDGTPLSTCMSPRQITTRKSYSKEYCYLGTELQNPELSSSLSDVTEVTGSNESSPSMPITDLVLRRKVRRPTGHTNARLETNLAKVGSMLMKKPLDFLSTPNFQSTVKQHIDMKIVPEEFSCFQRRQKKRKF